MTAARAAGGTVVDVDDMLTKHSLGEFQHRFRANMAAYNLLWTQTNQAKKNGCKPFCYVDLTAKEFLPDHIP